MPADLPEQILKAMGLPIDSMLDTSTVDLHTAGRVSAQAQGNLTTYPSTPLSPSAERAFCSMRFGDNHGVVPMATSLQGEMETFGKTLEIINMVGGGDIDLAVQEGIMRCDTFIVFGSAKYGEDTGNQACTYYESKFAHSQKKHIVLIRMISPGQEFEFPQARFMFGLNMREFCWEVGKPMPAQLPSQIKDAMENPTVSACAAAALQTANPVQNLGAQFSTMDWDQTGYNLDDESLIVVKGRHCNKRRALLGGLMAALVVLCLLGASIFKTNPAPTSQGSHAIRAQNTAPCGHGVKNDTACSCVRGWRGNNCELACPGCVSCAAGTCESCHPGYIGMFSHMPFHTLWD
jgi:hypothetical protein